MIKVSERASFHVVSLKSVDQPLDSIYWEAKWQEVPNISRIEKALICFRRHCEIIIDFLAPLKDKDVYIWNLVIFCHFLSLRAPIICSETITKNADHWWSKKRLFYRQKSLWKNIFSVLPVFVDDLSIHSLIFNNIFTTMTWTSNF